MVKNWWVLQNLLILLVMECYLVCTVGSTARDQIQRKTEVMVPGAAATTTTTTTSWSPPEGNTTFLDGSTWCVAAPGVSQMDLQSALDWACGLGSVDCRPIRSGGACYQPDNLVSHASYAFNTYYQQNGNNNVACNFGGTARLTKEDPSYEKCSFPVSGPTSSATAVIANGLNPTKQWRMFTCTLLLLYMYLGR